MDKFESIRILLQESGIISANKIYKLSAFYLLSGKSCQATFSIFGLSFIPQPSIRPRPSHVKVRQPDRIEEINWE